MMTITLTETHNGDKDDDKKASDNDDNQKKYDVARLRTGKNWAEDQWCLGESPYDTSNKKKLSRGIFVYMVCRRRNFPFCKRSLPFISVDAILMFSGSPSVLRGRSLNEMFIKLPSFNHGRSSLQTYCSVVVSAANSSR